MYPALNRRDGRTLSAPPPPRNPKVRSVAEFPPWGSLRLSLQQKYNTVGQMTPLNGVVVFRRLEVLQCLTRRHVPRFRPVSLMGFLGLQGSSRGRAAVRASSESAPSVRCAPFTPTMLVMELVCVSHAMPPQGPGPCTPVAACPLASPLQGERGCRAELVMCHVAHFHGA